MSKSHKPPETVAELEQKLAFMWDQTMEDGGFAAQSCCAAICQDPKFLDTDKGRRMAKKCAAIVGMEILVRKNIRAATEG